MTWPNKQTLDKIENFYGHLDKDGTLAAVQHGLSLLNVAGVVEALTNSLDDVDLAEIAAQLNELPLEGRDE